MKHREPLRKGKWTAEEEAYTAGIINHFTRGLLKLPEGTTLRAYLAEKLNCDPMRITKKFTGGSCLGKRVYHPPDDLSISSDELERAHRELDELEERFLHRLERIKERSSNMLAYDTRFFNTSNVVSTPGIDAMLFGQQRGGPIMDTEARLSMLMHHQPPPSASGGAGMYVGAPGLRGMGKWGPGTMGPDPLLHPHHHGWPGDASGHQFPPHLTSHHHPLPPPHPPGHLHNGSYPRPPFKHDPLDNGMGSDSSRPPSTGPPCNHSVYPHNNPSACVCDPPSHRSSPSPVPPPPPHLPPPHHPHLQHPPHRVSSYDGPMNLYAPPSRTSSLLSLAEAITPPTPPSSSSLSAHPPLLPSAAANPGSSSWQSHQPPSHHDDEGNNGQRAAKIRRRDEGPTSVANGGGGSAFGGAGGEDGDDWDYHHHVDEDEEEERQEDRARPTASGYGSGHKPTSPPKDKDPLPSNGNGSIKAEVKWSSTPASSPPRQQAARREQEEEEDERDDPDEDAGALMMGLVDSIHRSGSHQDLTNWVMGVAQKTAHFEKENDVRGKKGGLRKAL